MTIRSAPPRCGPLRAVVFADTCPTRVHSWPVSGPGSQSTHPKRSARRRLGALARATVATYVLAATAAAPRAARHRAPLRWKRARCPAPSSPEPPFQTASALSIRTAAQPPTQIGYPDSLGVRYRTRPAYPDSLSASPIPSPSQLTSIPPPMCVRSLIALVLSIRILIHSNGGPAAYPGRLSR